MNYLNDHILKRLYEARRHRGFSQRELSARSGVPQGHISKIENGDVDLRVSSLIALTRALNLELELVPRKASLAPAYDFVSTIPYIADEAMALKVSRSKRFDGFDMNELKHLAGGARLPEKLVVNVAQEAVALFYDKWASDKSHLPLSQHVVETIASTSLRPLKDT